MRSILSSLIQLGSWIYLHSCFNGICWLFSGKLSLKALALFFGMGYYIIAVQD